MSVNAAMVADPLPLAVDLIRADSVTPAGEDVMAIAARALAEAGFAVEHLTFDGEGGGPVRNLFATAGSGRHLVLAGHVDVVPPGPSEAWSHGPFSAAIDGDTLYGRGAQDMKGGVAAMIEAAAAWRADGGPGRVSFLITGDEEGPAINGTRPLAAWCAERFPIDVALVGEPTSREVLGDTIKVGRRGSLSGTVTVAGKQGHTAYPHNAQSPVPPLLAIAQALLEPIDEGSADFAPTHLEVTSIDIGNRAFNVIPAAAALRFNVRFNDHWSGASLKDLLAARIDGAASGAHAAVDWHHPVSDVFLTRDEDLRRRVADAVAATTGVTPEATTGGGTSDARYLKDHCPVIEFGAVGTTMHQVDERTSVSELRRLAGTYRAIIDSLLRP